MRGRVAAKNKNIQSIEIFHFESVVCVWGELIELERPLGKNYNCQEREGGAVIKHLNNGVRLCN